MPIWRKSRNLSYAPRILLCLWKHSILKWEFYFISRRYHNICRHLNVTLFLTKRNTFELIHISNIALQRYKSNGSLTRRRHWILWHCPWSLARRYISIISINNLSRLRATNVNRSNERKWSRTKKGKKQTISCRNNHWWRRRRQCSAYRKYI